MAIIAVCRTLNEERNIELFCGEYSKVADRILICDGGSEDRTVELASAFPKVRVVPFEERVHRGGIWRNPHGLHLNFMFDWAIDAGAGWIIFDDCDSLPNKHMKQVLHNFMKNPGYDTIMVRRLYLYKDEGYYPEMSEAGHARWAWRAHLKVRASEDDPWAHQMEFERNEKDAKLTYPSCLLHFSWPDDEEIARKAAFYRIQKKMPEQQIWHPSRFGGRIEPLPSWAVL